MRNTRTRLYSKLNVVIIIALVSINISSSANDSTLCKSVGNNWTWFADHLVSNITYRIVFSDETELIVGTGIFFKKPLGSIQTIKSSSLVTAYGMGAIHIKNKKEKLTKVCVTPDSIKLIEVIDEEF